MSKPATVRATGILGRWTLLWLVFASASIPLRAQVPAPAPPQAQGLGQALGMDWRHVGSTSVDLGLADVATGGVERAWYIPEGAIRIRTAAGSLWESSDFATWQPLPATAAVPPASADSAPALPEQGARIRISPTDPGRFYAFGKFVYRSDDSGRHWENLTGFRGFSILGDGLADLAVSPRNPDEITVAGGAGVFRTVNGGKSWHGLNESLPNLPGARLRSVPPNDGSGPQIELAGGLTLEWLPGESQAWTPITLSQASVEAQLRRVFSQQFGAEVTAVAYQDGYIYAGGANGQLWVSTDGTTPRLISADPSRGRVNRFWINPQDARSALAVLDVKPVAGILEPQTVLHTINGGFGWETVSGSIPFTSVNGVAVDERSRTAYIATDQGIFYTQLNLTTWSDRPQWTPLGVPRAVRVADVALDAERTQLWISLEGPGLYQTLAPHRLSDPLVVTAADRRARALAPGSVLSVVGAQVLSATANGQEVPVLATRQTESQIQIPYPVSGSTVALALNEAGGRVQFSTIPLRAASPAIFEVDGMPVLEDADRGTPIDEMNPGRSHMRVKIMAEGLGRVRPDWPAGVPAPLDTPLEVVEPVAVYLDGEPVEVLRAVLAPGYQGEYLVEIELPVLLKFGLADLYLRVGDQDSNHVRLFVEASY